MTRNYKIVLLVIGSICLMPVAFYGLVKMGEFYRFFDPYLDQEIAGPTIIPSEWQKLVPKKPLRVERQIQMIVMDLDKSIKMESAGWGVVLPDGSVVEPEVELISDDGKTYELSHRSFSWDPSTATTRAEFSLSDLPKDKAYREVRIRSDKTISVSRIYWRCYNQWDVS